MEISRAFALYFSPTGTTKHISSIISCGLPLPVEKIDLTPASFAYNPGSFGDKDLVIFSVPVYGGRVPDVALSRIKEKVILLMQGSVGLPKQNQQLQIINYQFIKETV